MSTPRHDRRTRRSRAGRALAGSGMAAALVCFTFAAFTLPAAASGESLSVSPSSGLTDGQSVTVTFTTTAATDAAVFVGVTQCGNATTSGTPLTVAGAGDCVGAEGFGTTLVVFGSAAGVPAGPVTAGTHSVTLKTKKTGIGANKAQCVPLAQAIIPCRVSAATATVSGAYTGPGYNFVVSGDISYTAPATTTTATSTTTSTSTSTTSTSTTSTTAPSSTTSTTTGSTSTTTPGSSTTSTTTAPTSTTSTTTAAPTSTTSTTAAPTTSTTAAPTTKTFDCNDIPLATSKLVLSKSRCVAPGETVTVSAPAGTFDGAPAAATGMTVSAGSAFVVQCNPDPAIPLDGSGCNIGALGVGVIGDDGSLAPTNVVVKGGTAGTDPRSVCPPSQAEANAGVINCVIGASPGGDVTKSLGAPFTVAGQTVVLPVDASGNATPPPTTPAGGGAAEVLGTTQISSAAVTPKGTLPYTGLGGNTWFIAGMAILLIDIGAVASSCAKRRMVG